MTLIHATAVAHGGRGVLLLGPSGAGKSDLALRLIDRGWRLVADDQVALSGGEPKPYLCAPARLKGFLEVRGLGIVQLPALAVCRAVLAVNLVAEDAVDRMPEPAWWQDGGYRLPMMSLFAFHGSTPLKIETKLTLADGLCTWERRQ